MSNWHLKCKVLHLFLSPSHLRARYAAVRCDQACSTWSSSDGSVTSRRTVRAPTRSVPGTSIASSAAPLGRRSTSITRREGISTGCGRGRPRARGNPGADRLAGRDWCHRTCGGEADSPLDRHGHHAGRACLRELADLLVAGHETDRYVELRGHQRVQLDLGLRVTVETDVGKGRAAVGVAEDAGDVGRAGVITDAQQDVAASPGPPAPCSTAWETRRDKLDLLVKLLREQVVHGAVAVVDHHRRRPGIKRAGDRRVGLGRHQPATQLVVGLAGDDLGAEAIPATPSMSTDSTTLTVETSLRSRWRRRTSRHGRSR